MIPAWKIVLIFLISVFESAILFAQSDSLEDLTFQFGLEFKSINTERYSFEKFRLQFPQSIESNKDFSSYHTDSTFEHYGIVPICMRLDYGRKAKLGNHKLVKNAMYRFMIEFDRSEMYYQNFLKEESNGDYMALDTIHRDFYAFEWNQRSVSFIFGIQFNSRFFFKKKRDRVWLGFYVLNGFSTGNIRKIHAYGESPGMYTGNTQGVDQFQYSGPSYSYYQKIENINTGMYYLMGFQMPVGYEHICGKSKNFGLGFQFLFGQAYLIGKGQTIPLLFGGLMYNFRFMI